MGSLTPVKLVTDTSHPLTIQHSHINILVQLKSNSLRETVPTGMKFNLNKFYCSSLKNSMEDEVNNSQFPSLIN